MRNDGLYVFLMALIICGLIAIFVSLQLVDAHTRTHFIRENGPIEMSTAVGYLLVLAIILAKGGRDFLTKHVCLLVVVGALGLRELDFHTRLTTMGIFKIKFYLSTQVPVSEKMIVLFVCLVLLTCVTVCVKKYLKSFLAGFTKDIVPMSIGMALLCMSLSVMLDGLPRRLRYVGIETTDAFSIFAESMEEIIELGIPLMLLVSAAAFFDAESGLYETGLPHAVTDERD